MFPYECDDERSIVENDLFAVVLMFDLNDSDCRTRTGA